MMTFYNVTLSPNLSIFEKPPRLACQDNSEAIWDLKVNDDDLAMLLRKKVLQLSNNDTKVEAVRN